MKTFRTFLILLVAALLTFQLVGDESYNCHNYAWESSRRWLDDPTPLFTEECDAADATRIVYFENDIPIHSGVYLGAGWVRSKWGQNPVVIHPIHFTTYGHDVKFYL